MTKKNSKRANTSKDVETSILIKSARRCPLCFHLKGDLSEKEGQIAHLDQDRSNGAEDNLAFMCMAHHSIYDSTTSQHKNFTLAEVKAAKANLYDVIAKNRHHEAPAKSIDNSDQEKQDDHDRNIFIQSEEVLPYERLDAFLDQILCDHSLSIDRSSQVGAYADFLLKTKNEFLNTALKEKAKKLAMNIMNLLDWTLSRFHIFPESQKGPDYRLCMNPKWNCDRGGDWNEENSRKYSQDAATLKTMANEIEMAYEEYRGLVKRTLYI